MTKKVIYHDFRQTNHPDNEPESTVVLTGEMLIKGRRWFRTWENLNATIDGACLVLCGACIAASVFTFLMLYLK